MRTLLINLAVTFSLLLSIPTSHLLAQGVDPVAKRITISLQSEPPKLDNSLSEDTTSGSLLVLFKEGLVRNSPRGEITPGVAESWDLAGQTITFHLRDNAMWQDGKPVTAHDFVFSWRRLVDPKTAAAGSTFFAYILGNAEPILKGRLSPKKLGVEALDDRTLKVTLSRPAPYALTVLGGVAYLPQRQDFVEAQQGRYGAESENLLSNGPFILADWVHNSAISLKKNPFYWDANQIKLNQIDVGYITSDVRSLLNVYKSHELAALRLSEEILDDALNSNLRVHKAPTNCLAWVYLNMHPGSTNVQSKTATGN